MVELFVEYWRVILLVVLLIVNILISIFRRPKVLNSIIDVINNIAPNCIIEAERLYGTGNGAKKLDCAYNLVCEYIRYRFNVSQKDLNKYDRVIKDTIEKILSTPQKKGE